MNERLDGLPFSTELYSPKRRTALVLTGVGTAGAYHAGVLRALHEAGVKLDIVAGRGIGAVGALFAAIAGEQRLWDEKGFWRTPAVRGFYRWRRVPQLVAGGLAVALAIVAIPLAAMALGLIVFPVDFVLKMVGLGGASGLTGQYLRVAQSLFAPESLPTWLPRLVVLTLGLCGAIVVVSGWVASRGRTLQGSWWWRAARPPIASEEIVAHVWRVLWDVVGGGAQVKQPARADLARRYVELLGENLGNPGFRELLLAAHDLDAHRDLVFALVAESRRRNLIRRPTTEAADRRRAEVIDLAGGPGDRLASAMTGSLTVPLATDAGSLTFDADGFWRGETHRVCDRTGILARILDELVDLDVAQIVLVSASPESDGPHALSEPHIDGRGRLGEFLQSAEAATVRDVTCAAGGNAPRIFTICPTHNPIGPFDFDGAYDSRSERRQPLGELMARGYEDAYRQFIEPVVAVSGERMGRIVEGV